jgi:hypothetical protein
VKQTLVAGSSGRKRPTEEGSAPGGFEFAGARQAPPLQGEHWRLNSVSVKRRAPVPICPASAISETMTSDLLCSVALRYDCSLSTLSALYLKLYNCPLFDTPQCENGLSLHDVERGVG